MSEYVIAAKNEFVSVADAIRAKTGSTKPLVFPAGFVEAVEGIQPGGGGVEGLTASARAVGIIPDLPRGFANSTIVLINIVQTTSAVGTVLEG